jgi:hypothetical protein
VSPEGIDCEWDIPALNGRHLAVLILRARDNDLLRHQDCPAVDVLKPRGWGPVEREISREDDMAALIDGGLNRRDVDVWVARAGHHNGLRRCRPAKGGNCADYRDESSMLVFHIHSYKR